MARMKYMALLLSLLLVCGCSETGDIDDIIVTKELKGEVSSVLRVDVNSLSFESAGGTKDFRITSNTGWVITHPDWCTLSSTSGGDDALITVTAAENMSLEQRSGSIEVKGVGVSVVSIQVNQAAKEKEQTVPGSNDNPPPSV